MNKIILLSGKQGSGKTTIMNTLSTHFKAEGHRVVPVIFADTIYRIHDFAIDLLKQRGIERPLVKDGKLLQLLGTEWGRQTIGENVWVDCLKGEIAAHEKELTGEEVPTIFLVSDCRFKNEFDGIEAFKVRLEASKEVRKARCSQWRDNDTHPSEVDLDEYSRLSKFHCYVDTEGRIDTSLNHILACFHKWEKKAPNIESGFGEVSKKYYF